MKVLHFCLGLYNFWTTYEGEYINESLMARSDIDLRIWGRDRIGYIPGLSAVDVIKHLYGNDYPDIVIVHSSMEKHKDVKDTTIFNGMEKINKRCILVWRTFDCFPNKQDFYIKQIKKYNPSIVLVWYPGQVSTLKKLTGSNVYFFPHAVGRRYYNKNCIRPYDIGLIGRCQHKERALLPKHFGNLKVFTPPGRKTRPDKGNNLVNDLNLCKFSWNSPVHGSHTSLRFVEAPACGAISVVPNHFRELDGYFPHGSYIVCESVKNAIRQIKNMSTEEYIHIQQLAYKHVMKHHTMDRRVEYLLDIVSGKNTSPFEYGDIH